MKDDGGPAYPCKIEIHFGSGRTEIKHEPGMSLRDAIALSAISGRATSKMSVRDMETLASRAYTLADAMLKERAK